MVSVTSKGKQSMCKLLWNIDSLFIIYVDNMMIDGVIINWISNEQQIRTFIFILFILMLDIKCFSSLARSISEALNTQISKEYISFVVILHF